MRGQAGFAVWIDMIRWMAAASVLLTHIAIRMLPPFGAQTNAWQAAYLFLAGFDHQAVMVFFVLSGWLVGGAVWRDASAGRLDLRDYALRRLVRLCLVLWPALGLAGLCVAAGAPPGDTSIGTLLCNMAFLQTAACPQFAGNGALWSLFNEAWYYAAVPALALAAQRGTGAGRRAALAAACAAVLALLTALQFTGAPLGPYMAVWLLGAGASTLRRPPVPPAAAAWLVAACLLAIRLLVRRSFAPAHPAASYLLDLAASACVALLLASLANAPATSPPWPALHRTLAGFSFSLYCTHVPVLGLLTALLGAAGWDLGEWRAIALAWLACGASAWAFSRLTEAHTATVRHWLHAGRLRTQA